MMEEIYVRLFTPLAKYDADTIMSYATEEKRKARDNIEKDCWDTIMRIARVMRFADYIFEGEFEKEERE